jgi:hypothetical protein
MFSINKLVHDLELNQEKIDKSILDSIPDYKEEPNKSLFEEYIKNSTNTMKKLNSIICSKYCYIDNFYYNNITWKQNTFIYSILVILDNNFDFLLNKRKSELIDAIRKKMCYDLVEKNYYGKLGYTRKRKFKREKLQKYLMDAKTNIDNEKYYCVRKYIVDYFNINVFVVSDTEVKCIYTEKDNNGFFKYRPTIILYYDCNTYYPVIKNVICNEKLYLDYNNNKDIITELINDLENPMVYYNPANIEHTNKNTDINSIVSSDDDTKSTISSTELDTDTKSTISSTELDTDTKSIISSTELDTDTKSTISSTELDSINMEIKCTTKDVDYKKMKIAVLQQLCEEYGIDIYKISEKTKKKIKKTKSELINNINNIKDKK